MHKVHISQNARKKHAQNKFLESISNRSVINQYKS